MNDSTIFEASTEKGKISASLVGNDVVFKVVGSFDQDLAFYTSGEHYTKVVRSSGGLAVFDMTELEHFDTAALRVAIQTNEMFDANGSVVFRNPKEFVTRLLEITGLADVFTIETTD